MSAYCHYLLLTIPLGLLLRFSVTSGNDLPPGVEVISMKLCGKIILVEIANVNGERFSRVLI